MKSAELKWQFLKVTLNNPYVLLITLNRPQAANAFNTQMASELVSLFEGLTAEMPDLRAIVLTGAGSRAFCAGADLKERKGMSDECWQKQHLVFDRMIAAILACPIPLIGAINGAAYGGGCEIAAALDFIYVADTARFAQSEVKLGIIPGIGGTQTLARSVGEKRSKELILSGREFSAKESVEWGLANAVFASEDLLPNALAIANTIASNAPIAVKLAKNAIQTGLEMSLRDGMSIERQAYNVTITSSDRREGIIAFNEKREAVFDGL